jgi:hypothetical protein
VLALPLAYPTIVVQTPSTRSNLRCGFQNHPKAKTATLLPTWLAVTWSNREVEEVVEVVEVVEEVVEVEEVEEVEEGMDVDMVTARQTGSMER